jgi:hypothetical protein
LEWKEKGRREKNNQVAAAAPATPMPRLNMSRGSSNTLMALDTADILRGVNTSKVPLKAAKATVESRAGMKVRANIQEKGKGEKGKGVN